jgi:hypothetical protein
MKLLLYISILALSPMPLIAAPCPTPQARDTNTLIQLEQTWAQALEGHDADAVGCILAEEFQVGVPRANPHRAETLAQIPHRRPGKNILSELDPHVFGDLATSADSPPLVDGQGKTKARVRFTDIYVIATSAGSRSLAGIVAIRTGK